MMIHPPVVRNILVGEALQAAPPPVEPDEPGIVFPSRHSGQPPLQISFNQLSTGLVLLGGTGCGKSNVYRFLIDQLLGQLKPGSIALLFDPKGEFTKQVLASSGGHRVVLLSSDPADGSQTSHWNIYEELLCSSGAEEGELMARSFAKALFADQLHSQQPFFGYAAADIFGLILIHHIRQARASGDYSLLNNAALVSFINRLSVEQLHQLIDQNPDYGYVASFIGERGAGMTPQSLGVLGTLHSVVNATFIGPFRKAGKPLSMARLFRERTRHATVVLLKYTVKHKDALERILSLVVDQFIKEALSTEDGAGDTFLLLDEMPMLPHLEMLSAAVNFGRSKGMKTVCGLQSVAQLPKEQATSILAGFSSCLGFRCVDAESRQYLFSRYGETFEELSYGGKAVTQPSHLIRDCDLRALTTGTAYADFPGHSPFCFAFPKYRKL